MVNSSLASRIRFEDPRSYLGLRQVFSFGVIVFGFGIFEIGFRVAWVVGGFFPFALWQYPPRGRLCLDGAAGGIDEVHSDGLQ